MLNNINTQNQNNKGLTQSQGGLVVTVATASDTRPIMNAHVIISKRDGSKEQILRTFATDANGRTPVIELSTPPMSNSLSPGMPIPYSVYDIRVDYPGYYTVENIDVPIFPGNIAVQPINLMPLPIDTYNGKVKIFNEREPFDLIEEESRGRQ